MMPSGLSGLSGLSAVCGGAAPSLAARLSALLGPSVPFWVPGPQYFFADAAKTTPCGDTDLCRVWADGSGLGLDLPQATSTARPAARFVNGKWCLEFDGVDDWMAYNGAITCGTVGVVASHPASTFADYSTLLGGDLTGVETLAGQVGAATWFNGGVFGVPGATLTDGTDTSVFAPATGLKRLVSWALGTPQINPRLVVGAGRSTYPPTGRWWPGRIAAIVLAPTVLGSATRLALDALLSECQ